MKKKKWLINFCIPIVLFNCFFIIISTYYNNIIIVVNSFFKPITKDYYFWFLNRSISSTEDAVFGVSILFKMIFSLIFILEFLYLISNKQYLNVIGKKNVLKYLVIGFFIYAINFLFIKYKAEHYRLFMTLISVEIFSLVLLKLILIIFRNSCPK